MAESAAADPERPRAASFRASSLSDTDMDGALSDTSAAPLRPDASSSSDELGELDDLPGTAWDPGSPLLARHASLDLHHPSVRAASYHGRVASSGRIPAHTRAASTHSFHHIRASSTGGDDKSWVKGVHARKSSTRLSTFYTSSHASADERAPEEIYEVEWHRTPDNSLLTQPRKYPSNFVRTTKYTVWTFLPINLFHQFQRFYNLYFLLSAIFVLVEPSLDPVTNTLPLAIVLSITALKDALEDYGRYKQDKDANSTLHKIVRHGSIENVLSRDIVPGNVLKITKGERIPADVVILATSLDEGECYVDTMNLDGETSLKRRTAVQYTQPYATPQRMMDVSGCIECELPNERLNLFEGIITMDSADKPREIEPLTLDNLLLRGTYLRNTEFVYAVVLYVGNETKVYKNLKESGLKFSTLERKINKLILVIFAYKAVLLTVSMTLLYVPSEERNNRSSPNAWYLGEATSASSRQVGGSFMTFFAIYTFLIPISIFVSMEIVRIILARFMIWDNRMRADDGRRMKVHNSNLHEDLGAIEYILSDKTGTLTQNKMRLSKWHVGMREYDAVHAVGSIKQHLQSSVAVDRTRLINFCRCVALCHTVVTVDGAYESPSPDEGALLEAMRDDDVLLTERTKETMTISLQGEAETYELLHVLDFNSDRKRMSVIVRNARGIFLFCKGADSIITARLRKEEFVSAELESTNRAISKFAVNGLRTLMMAWRKLSEREYDRFAKKMAKAERALTKREARINKACESIEINLSLLGCSAIEDRLQEEVPETIEYLLKCGIKIWLLTGDKQETAVKVGMSSRLIDADMNIMRLNVSSAPECSERLDVFAASVAKSVDTERNALVIDGASLVYVTLLPELTTKFLDVGVKCRSVICCRVTPLQKALVVKMIKKQLHKVTLSIGDGANDVSMIQAAHVGVGIEGVEGAQAVRASDYSFVEFRALRHLIAIHGRYSILRMANLILFSFYKSIALINVQFWFGFMNAWSGSSLYFDVFLTVWNVVFTGLPPILAASFDKDVDEERIMRFPELYLAAKAGKFWNHRIEAGWLSAAFVHSLIIFGALVWSYGSGILDPAGRGTSQSLLAFMAGSLVLFTVSFKYCLMNRYWVWLTGAGLVGSLIVYVLAMLLFDSMGFLWETSSFALVHRTPTYYLLLLVIPVLCNLPDYLSKYVYRNYYPDDAMIVKELPAPEQPMTERA